LSRSRDNAAFPSGTWIHTLDEVTIQIRVAAVGDVAAVRGFAHRVVAPHYAPIGLPEFGEATLANF
jgi:hypothetical protein